MLRTDVIQDILIKKKADTYLEIGVAKGDNFFPLNAKQKIAVDPRFRFKLRKKLKWLFKNRDNLKAKYHQVGSDDYFENEKLTCPLDVAFIDGLHSYQQSLKDVNNTLKHLKDDGVIIMHDCFPPNEASAHPATSVSDAASMNLPGWTGQWCGDVWKTVCYLRSNRDDLKIFVLDCDCGLGVITKSENESTLDLTVEDIDKLTYNELVQNKEKYLDLKHESYFFEFLKTL